MIRLITTELQINKILLDLLLDDTFIKRHQEKYRHETGEMETLPIVLLVEHMYKHSKLFTGQLKDCSRKYFPMKFTNRYGG